MVGASAAPWSDATRDDSDDEAASEVEMMRLAGFSPTGSNDRNNPCSGCQGHTAAVSCSRCVGSQGDHGCSRGFRRQQVKVSDIFKEYHEAHTAPIPRVLHLLGAMLPIIDCQKVVTALIEPEIAPRDNPGLKMPGGLRPRLRAVGPISVPLWGILLQTGDCLPWPPAHRF